MNFKKDRSRYLYKIEIAGFKHSNIRSVSIVRNDHKHDMTTQFNISNYQDFLALMWIGDKLTELGPKAILTSGTTAARDDYHIWELAAGWRKKY